MASPGPHPVLVVDDVAAQRYAVAHMLRGAGYTVLEAATGREALDTVAARELSLIVLDVKLPDMSGFEVAETIKADPDLGLIPILHLSAVALTDRDKARGLQSAEAYLTQPVSREVLLATADALIRIRHTELSLRDSAQRLSWHLANVPAAVTEWDHEFRVRYWSPQAENMFGWSAAEVMGKSPWEFDFVVEGDVPQVQQIHSSMRDGRAASTISVNRNRHKDGSILNCEWYNSSLKGEAGETSILAITLDVSTRVHYEEEISQLNRELQRRVGELETLLQTMPVGIAIADDPECRHIRGNMALGRMLGISPNGNVSMSAPEGERPPLKYFRDGVEVPLAELPQQVVGRTGREVRDTELEFERPDGSRGVMFGHAMPLFDEEGRTRGSVAAWTDITERRRMEEQLRRREQTLTLAFRAAGMWSWEVGLADRRVRWSEEARDRNPGYQEVTTFEAWLERVHRDDREDIRQKFEAAARGESEYEAEFRIERAGADTAWIYARGTLVRDAAGNPERMIGVGMDYTDRKRTEEALRASEKLAATGKLAAALAHEINNPLAAITNLIYLINHDPGLSQVSTDYLSMAVGELDRVAHITRSMLSFYRRPTAPSNLIVSRVLEGVVALHRPQLQAAGVELELRVHSERPAIGYAAELQQVVSNLLLNAMESMAGAGGGRVVVEVRAARRWTGDEPAGTRISIVDNGPGVPIEHRQRLFEPFFSTKGGKGTGLGLWVSSNLVERNGGTLRFRSSTSSQRHGTCFRVFLPDAAHRQPSLKAQTAARD